MILKTVKCVFIIGVPTLVITIAVMVLSNYVIVEGSKGATYDNTSDIPQCKTALILGTSKYVSGGRINLYFKYRIDAAEELYKSGKVKYLIVSGDNSHSSYNEPLDMKNQLIAQGVPQQVIFLDYAGFRTFDSVIRIKEIFSQDSFIVVSQKFHNERAIYIAKKHNIQAFGYNANDVGGNYGVKTMVRERLARVKVFVDIATGKKSKFLGEKIHVGE